MPVAVTAAVETVPVLLYLGVLGIDSGSLNLFSFKF